MRSAAPNAIVARHFSLGKSSKAVLVRTAPFQFEPPVRHARLEKLKGEPTDKSLSEKASGVLASGMPSEPPQKNKRDDEAPSREDKTQKDDKDSLQPAQEKIPEGSGNLRRRADWFQKRSGQTS
jgi:hypothetical protein